MKKAVVVNYTDSYEQRAYLVREYLVKKGYETTVFMSDILHRQKIRRGDEKKGFHFVRTLMYKKNISPARILSLWDFSRRALSYLKKESLKKEAPELVYVFVPANSSAYFCARYKKKHPNVTLVFDVNDLWPETLPVKEKWKSLPPLKVWGALRDRFLPAADVVIGECDLFSERLRARSKSLRPVTIHMPSAQREVQSTPVFHADRIELGYLGSVNNIIDIDSICKLVKALCAHAPVRFHIVGAGEKMAEFVRALKETGAQVEDHGLIFDEEEKQRIFDSCRYGMNMMKQSVCVGLSLKSVDYLRMGLPLLNSIGDDTWRMVEEHAVGVNVTDDLESSARAVAQMDEKTFFLLRENCKALYRARFTPQVFEQKLDETLGFFDLKEESLPRVTVLLAAYNGQAYLPQQLDSLLAQDYPNLRVVLCDDGSKDESACVLDAYAQKYPERFVRYHAPQRFGNAQSHFMHLLSRFAQTDYCMFCDQDDVWLSDKVSRSMRAMRRAEAGDASLPILVHTDLTVVDGDLNVRDASFLHYSALDGRRNTLAQTLVQNVVTGCTMLMNPALCRVALSGGAPDRMRDEMMMHDWWIALCASAFGRIVFVPQPTILYRQHGKNAVGAKNVRSVSYALSRVKGGDAKDAMNKAMRQAGAFAEVYEDALDASQLALCRGYAACEKKGRLARSVSFLRLRTFKCGLKRIVAQLLVG